MESGAPNAGGGLGGLGVGGGGAGGLGSGGLSFIDMESLYTPRLIFTLLQD